MYKTIKGSDTLLTAGAASKYLEDNYGIKVPATSLGGNYKEYLDSYENGWGQKGYDTADLDVFYNTYYRIRKSS